MLVVRLLIILLSVCSLYLYVDILKYYFPDKFVTPPSTTPPPTPGPGILNQKTKIKSSITQFLRIFKLMSRMVNVANSLR